MESDDDPASVVPWPAVYSQGGFVQIRTVVVAPAKRPDVPLVPEPQEPGDDEPTTPTDLVA